MSTLSEFHANLRPPHWCVPPPKGTHAWGLMAGLLAAEKREGSKASASAPHNCGGGYVGRWLRAAVVTRGGGDAPAAAASRRPARC